MRPKLVQLGKFLLVGCSNMAVSAAVFWLWRRVAPDSIGTAAIAQVLAYSAGIVWSYKFNRKWTFAARTHESRLVRFLALQLALLVVTSLTLAVLVDAGGAPVALTWLGVMAAATAANYLVQRRWVFRDPTGEF